jgi:hypothetical protein
MKEKTKHILLILIMAMMLAPAIQGYFLIIPEKALFGDFQKLEKPYLDTERWLDGSYQEEMVPYLEQNTGFHNSLVRLHNQIDYSIFKKPTAEGVIIGKNGQLYEYDYIRAYTGIDFVGEEILDKKLRKLKFLQEYLKDSLGIDLVLVLEPGKASVYPENIPDRFLTDKQGISNYHFILDRAGELNISMIDFNNYFIELRNKLEHPVFPKYGTHWSEFAMWYAADSLIRYTEKIRDINLPGVIKDGFEISEELRSTDYDVAASMNLMFELDHGPMPYPVFQFEDADSTHTRPMVLAVADSYYWNIFNTGIPKHLFANEAFWYFYKLVYPDTYDGEKMVDDLKLQEEIEKQEIIYLMVTERFLYKLGWGFIEDLYAIYGKTSLLDRISSYQQNMTLTEDWFTSLISKADEQGLSLGEIMDIDARYMLRIEDPAANFSLLGPSSLIHEIRENEEWYESVRRNAVIKNINISQQIVEEAEFLINSQHPQALANYYRLTGIKDSIVKDSTLSFQLRLNMAYYYLTEEEMLQAMAEEIYAKDTLKVREE